MKKTLFFVCLLIAGAAYAQNDEDEHSRPTDSSYFYKYSIGLNISTLGDGISAKYGISKNCVFQTDLAGRFFANKYSKEKSFLLYVFELSQNFLFQKPFAENNGVMCYYMVGGGASGGITMLRPHLWKVGVYPLVGMEFVLKKPKLSFQIDVRVGYSSLLKSANAKPPRTDLDNNPLWLFGYTGAPSSYPYHGYDVSVNFAIRFCKIKSIVICGSYAAGAKKNSIFAAPPAPDLANGLRKVEGGPGMEIRTGEARKKML